MLEIRPATLDDLEAISRIHADTWKAAYRGKIAQSYLDELSHERWLPVFEETIAKQTHQVYLALTEGRPTGVVTFGPPRDETMLGLGELAAIYVLPEHWSSGQGYRLLRLALEELRQAGYQGCYLWVLEGNERACRFYERQGFAADGGVLEMELAGETLRELRYRLLF